VTTLRPERPADGPMSYEDTGQFAAVVGQLADPLNDPLPDRPPAVPEERAAAVPASAGGAGGMGGAPTNRVLRRSSPPE